MKCPKCKSENLAVKDSRTAGSTIKRRRECVECGYRFTTYESQMYINDEILKHLRKALKQYVKKYGIDINENEYKDLEKCYKSIGDY